MVLLHSNIKSLHLFNALIPPFLQLLYTLSVWKNCSSCTSRKSSTDWMMSLSLHTVYHVGAASTGGTGRSLNLSNMVDEATIRSYIQLQQTSQRRRCELQCIIMQQISTPRLRFLRCCASRSSIYFIDIICACDRGTFWQIVCHYNSLMSQKTVTITLPADGVNDCFAMVCVVNVSNIKFTL